MSDNENIEMEMEQDDEPQFSPIKEYFFPDGTLA